MEYITYAGDEFPRLQTMVTRMRDGKPFVTADELRYDSAKLQAMAQLAAATGTYNVPTLCRMNIVVPWRSELDALLARPEVRYVNPMYRSMWEPAVKYGEGYSAAERNLREKFNQVQMDYVTALHQAGAPLLIGTDAPNPMVLPGYSVHDELGLFVKAGLTPFEALAAATRVPAELLNAVGKFGTVTEGARADLVLVHDNPLVDVSHMRNPDGVMVRGRWISQEEMHHLLEEMATSFENQEN